MLFTIRKLQINFINKNWPNDFTIGCKSLSNLVELVETNVDLEGKLKKFEKFLKGIKLWSF
jgi:hypothetical protein